MNLRPNEVDPTDSLPPALQDSFLEGLRAGDVDRLRQMLEEEPLLSQLQSRGLEAPLFLASVNSDADKAIEMIDLLMENGAVLGSRAVGELTVLQFACYHGVEWKVVECLLKWNALKGGNDLDWSHREENGRSPLLWACSGGHLELALRILDEIDMGECSTANHPFAVLDKVIRFTNEASALAIAEHPKIRAAVQAYSKTVQLKHPSLRDCVASAVRREMTDMLRLLDNWNHPTVPMAIWFATFKYSKEQDKVVPKTTNAVILGWANQFAKDQRWEKVRGLLFLRHRGLDAKRVDGQLRADLLVGLPDPLFRLVVAFIKPSMTHRSDVDRVTIELLV